MSVALIVIAGSGTRAHLIDDHIIPSAHGKFDEILVVGEHHEGKGFRYLHVPDLTKTTNDALVKRDVGTLAAQSDWLFYLSDDHAVVSVGKEPRGFPAPIVVPHRSCAGHPILNMGFGEGYVGGHGGLFHRSLIRARPWTTMPHDRLWDLLASRIQQQMGAPLLYDPDWHITDLTPETRPWE